MAAGLFAGALGTRLVQYAVAGTLGNLVVKGASRLRPHVAPVARRAAVRAVAGGIVGGRKLGDVAEEARLQAGDVVAEARAALGETAPSPGEAGSTPPVASPEPAPAHEKAPSGGTASAKATSARKNTARKGPARKAAPRRSGAADHGHEH